MTHGNRLDPSDLAVDLQERLRLEHAPVGFRYADTPPPGARSFGSGQGCIAPLVRAAGRGGTFVLTPEACGLPCAAFYLGFSEWIFPGIERFLAHGPMPGRGCERLISNSRLAREFLEQQRNPAPPGQVAVLAPLARFPAGERPDLAILLANADQISALVFLLHYDGPADDRRVVTQLASACASMITLPMRTAREGGTAAHWGSHDLSARARLPAQLTSLAMPLPVLEAAWRYAPESFLGTDQWARIAARQAPAGYADPQ